jgi:two-component sensor histidine kinase/PAS domain-containing protein
MTLDKKVLAISKDSALLETVQVVLQEGGCDVRTATSGREGLDLYDMLRPSIVIVTCQLEDMDGLKFLSLLDARQDSMAFVLFICADKRILNDVAIAEIKLSSKAMVVSFIDRPIDNDGLRAMVSQIFYFNDRHADRLANLNSIIEMSPSIIIDVDHDGNIAYCNKAAEKTIKYNFQEIVGRNFISTLTRGDFQDNNIANLFSPTKSGASKSAAAPGSIAGLKKSIYTIIIDRDKDDLYCKLNFQDIGVGGKSYYRVVLSGIKRVDKLGEVIKFSDVFRVSEIGIAIVDLNNRIIHDNEVIKTIFASYGVSDILNKDVTAVMRFLHADLDFDALVKIVNEKQEAKQDIQTTGTVGRIDPGGLAAASSGGAATASSNRAPAAYYTIKVKPLFDAADELLGYLIILIDTTEVRESEAAVVAINDYLHQSLGKNVRDLKDANEKIMEEFARRERLEEHLQSMLKDKTMLLREVHHRVKNNLQVITSMLSLQAEDIVEPSVMNIFMDCQSRIRTMALIHDKLYQSHNLSVFNFAEYLDDLVGDLFHTYRVSAQNISYNVECNVEDINLDLAISCGLIINEIISNCLKYAFPNGRSGQLNISYNKLDDGRLEIMVKDNGVGFTKIIDVSQSTSLGMRMIYDLGKRKLKGTVDMTQDNGVTWKITFMPPAPARVGAGGV